MSARTQRSGTIKNKYIPGDITSFINQHPSRSALYTRQESQEKVESLKNGAQSLTAGMNKISLEPICTPMNNFHPSKSSSNKLKDARAKSAFAAAYHNFQTAKKMAQENLDHQPLPDAILDKNFTELQAQGDPNPGLGLDVQLTTTGIGYKGYKVGPTQCTKLKVYRPKTCGVLPKHLDKSTMSEAINGEQIKLGPKIGPMDLAIGWDYRPKNREPKLPKHIDGSNDIVASVFTLVPQQVPEKENIMQFERAEGVFHNTQGEIDFFDRDLILKRKDYQKKYEKERECTCGTDVASFSNVPGSESIAKKNRPKTSKSDSAVYMTYGKDRRCKSSPNLSMIVNPRTNTEIGSITTAVEDPRKIPVNNLPIETNEQKKVLQQPRYAHPTIPRMCHQMRHDYEKMMKKYFLTNELMKLDENNNCSFSSPTPPISKKPQVIYVPRPKQPYKKKNYRIESLAPPFSSWTGRGDEFPNHLRLSSIYQQAYKPVESRKRRFLQAIHR
ncbi:CLUMA_CG011785, isoform A [Clunio marinus]|uniref:CLUMA_CG011785, isoform A n=1 Tax=Clunio marinus TaxID=568069 RepID=A0A1J1IDY7_9DIPT|nr:CLUMA_CG011785, isoform A [Clunio marinus]